ncbi:beta-lactamase family protein [Chryseobacterium sp. SSA4.19]|uniref:serine hydrolase domain-containing protein n=1 Tax=Chryseobacterium sp. SSA4.19 TaxID=2919915 RepID=UPI001F4E5F0D|nr:serine hydrolase [Chryseobacterium sp. SSA4.19]MCJ8154647.1 beta-lactamase family protein [Chryseobacterium sp. SSA4.19]
MKVWFQIAVFFILLSSNQCCAQIASQHVVQHILDSSIIKKMNENCIVGLGASVIVDKKQVWHQGYGFAGRTDKIAFTPSTVMNIASISKTITGVCLMKAVEQNKVSLDTDINNYLPFRIINPYFPDEKITLRNLATHTSGLADRYPFYTDSLYTYAQDAREPLGDFLKDYFVPGGKHYSKDNFLNHKPGTYRDYSNIGAGLAGYIVERQTGMKLNLYSRKYIFKPLGMKHTGWFFSEVNLKTHTKLYSKEENLIKEIPLYSVVTYPDGGVRTTVDDLSRFFIFLLNDGKYKGKQIFKKESIQEMMRFQFTKDHTPGNVNPDKLNSGLFWATKMSATRIGHNGSDPGVRTFMLSDLNKEVAVILFSNTSLTESEEDKFFDIYNDLYKFGLIIKNAQSKAPDKH